MNQETCTSPYIRAITALEEEIAELKFLLKDKTNSHGSTPTQIRLRIDRLKRAITLIKVQR